MSEKKEEVSPFQQQPQPQPPQQQQLNGLSQELGYDVPMDSVTLPSKGLIYALDHPLCNEEAVEIRCMTAKEEDLLTSRSLIKNGTVLDKLMQSCLMNKTIKADNLLTGDRNAILISIRVTGYGPDYTVKTTCPECDEQYDNNFSLSGLEIKRLGAQPLQANVNLFSYILPMTKREVHFRLLTGHDEFEISRLEKQRKKQLGIQTENTITSRLMHSIVSINGETDRSKISRLVLNMPAGDARGLRKYIDDIEPGVNMNQWSTCKHCGEESEVSIPLGIGFFWPDFS